MYDRYLQYAFQWVLPCDSIGEAHGVVSRLIQPVNHDDYPLGGTSFALTVRPRLKVWLSDASLDRLTGDQRARVQKTRR